MKTATIPSDKHQQMELNIYFALCELFAAISFPGRARLVYGSGTMASIAGARCGHAGNVSPRCLRLTLSCVNRMIELDVCSEIFAQTGHEILAGAASYLPLSSADCGPSGVGRCSAISLDRAARGVAYTGRRPNKEITSSETNLLPFSDFEPSANSRE